MKRARTRTALEAALDDEERALRAVVEQQTREAKRVRQCPAQRQQRPRPQTIEEFVQAQPNARAKTGSVFYCSRIGWSEDPKLKELKGVAPAPWEVIRFRIELDMGLLVTQGHTGSYVQASLVTDFENPQSVKQAPLLQDGAFVLEEGAVLVVTRRPKPRDLPSFVPLSCLRVWWDWVTTHNARIEARMARSGGGGTKCARYGKGAKIQPHRYTTRHWRFTQEGTVRRAHWGGHVSEFPGGVPPRYKCRHCKQHGRHLASECPYAKGAGVLEVVGEARAEGEVRGEGETEGAPPAPLFAVVPMSKKKIVKGIPFCKLLLVPEDSPLVRFAPLRTYEGRVYINILDEPLANEFYRIHGRPNTRHARRAQRGVAGAFTRITQKAQY